jgi:7-cyano-7-deazaguanine synthase
VKNVKKAIVLFSGGLDSVTALYWAMKEGYSPIALSFMEHGRQKSEIKAARNIVKNLDIQNIEIPLEFIMQKDELLKIGISLPNTDNLPPVFIPQKNLIFYSIAAHYAERYEAEYIIVGLLSFDFNVFPDNSIDYFKKLEQLINIGKSTQTSKISILFPLKDLNKSEVIKLALDLKVPLECTWSCYEEEDKNGMPCGKCKACLERKRGFFELDKKDPIFQKKEQ